MQNMERQKFEDSWKKAFENAAVSPSENVWTNIELDLEKAKGSHLKRRLLFYQMVAAACVIFSLGVGVGVFVVDNNGAAQTTLVAEKASSTSEDKIASNETVSSEKNLSADKNSSTQNSSVKSTAIHGKKSTIAGSTETSNSNSSIGKVSNQEQYIVSEERNDALLEESESYASFTEEKPMTPLVVERTIRLAYEKEEPKVTEDPVALMMARLVQREREIKENENRSKKEMKGEKLWTSVGFAAGSFSQMNPGSANPQSSLAATSFTSSVAKQEAKASGTSYTVGANVGTRLSNRWVLQGGVNYLTQSSDYTTNGAVVAADDHSSFKPASINELKKLGDAQDVTEERLVATAPYNVNNNLRYLSIPMQAGYMIINKNIGLQLNAGVATDLFLQNTVTGEGNNLGTTSQGRGSDSPYRSFNMSGLMGTELSYRFSDRYRIAFNPGIRYPFSSIYRSSLDIKAMPLTFDVGVRFRYIFH